MRHIFIIFLIQVTLNYASSSLNGNRTKRQSCPEGSRLCKSGECFSLMDACDGIKNCKDGSDETAELCKELDIRCPSFTFTCDYGGCLDTSKVCNKINDCVDGSDEKYCPGGGNQTSPPLSDNTISTCQDDPYKFKCRNKECIDSTLICDGELNCSDGSDETNETCSSFKCPSFLYRCAYGGCIDQDKACNGVADCVDSSDESQCAGQGKPITTPPPTSTTLRYQMCPNYQFRCKNNACINMTFICDGDKDCQDGSDETREVCEDFGPCPGFTFTCAYGGCTSGVPCNGITDCADGSDEAISLCGEQFTTTSTTTTTTTPKPTPTPPTRPTPAQPPTIPPPTPSGFCVRPPNPAHGVYLIGGCALTDNSPICNSNSMTPGSALRIKCNPGYRPEGKEYAFCFNSRLNPPQLKCELVTCPPLNTISSKFQCTRNNQKDAAYCENPLPGTKVQYECNYGYQALEQNIDQQFSHCVLKENIAVWEPPLFECRPECGLEPPTGGDGFIAGGVNAKIGMNPWHCGVYEFTDKIKSFRQICGGTLVSPRVVLSAAHCFSAPDNPDLYRIIFGKVTRDYKVEDQTQREYKISKIINNEKFSTQVFDFDISFVILIQDVHYSQWILPACLDLGNKFYKSLIVAGSEGQVAGWGLNQDNIASPILQSTKVPYRDYNECKRNVPNDFKPFVTGLKICAGNLNGSTVCPGDSGGGLLFRSTEGKELYYLMGIVSAGVKNKYTETCVRNQYTTFTDLVFQLQWIKDQFEKSKEYYRRR